MTPDDGGGRLLGILITFRRPRELALMLQRLADSVKPVDLLVVVDNSPTPDAERLVERYRARDRAAEYVAAPENLGPAGAVALAMRRLLPTAGDDDWIVLFDDGEPPGVEELAEMCQFALSMRDRGLAELRWAAVTLFIMDGLGIFATLIDPTDSPFIQVLAVAIPAILTGTVLTIARAFGESAPLLLAGAQLSLFFSVSSDASFADLMLNQPYTALPIVVFNFARQPQAEFVALTAASIVVLLVMLLTVNAVAVIARDRYERRYR